MSCLEVGLIKFFDHVLDLKNSLSAVEGQAVFLMRAVVDSRTLKKVPTFF